MRTFSGYEGTVNSFMDYSFEFLVLMYCREVRSWSTITLMVNFRTCNFNFSLLVHLNASVAGWVLWSNTTIDVATVRHTCYTVLIRLKEKNVAGTVYIAHQQLNRCVGVLQGPPLTPIPQASRRAPHAPSPPFLLFPPFSLLLPPSLAGPMLPSGWVCITLSFAEFSTCVALVLYLPSWGLQGLR